MLPYKMIKHQSPCKCYYHGQSGVITKYLDEFELTFFNKDENIFFICSKNSPIILNGI